MAANWLRGSGALLLLALAVMAVYADVYDNAFLLDDEFLILKNAFLRNWDSLGDIFTTSSTAGFGGTDNFYRPLQITLYLLVYQFAGASEPAFHFLNIMLHAANACLLLVLARGLGFNPVAAFLAALLWAVHPVHTEAVTYMSATADVLYAFFCLLGAAVLAHGPARRAMLPACVCFIAGLLAKETAIIFPLLAISVVSFRHEGAGRARALLATWPLWLIAAIYIALRFTLLDFDGMDFYKTPNHYSEDMAVRVWTFLATLPAYLQMLFWPAGLHMEREFPVFASAAAGPVLGGAAIMLLASALFVRGAFGKAGRGARSLGWGIFWAGAAYAPCTGILLPVNALVLEHWLYLPAAGLAIGAGEAVAVTLGRWRRAQSFAVIAALAVAATLGICTYRQNTVWRDAVTFYSHILRHESGVARVYNNLGMAYEERGDYARAVEQYRKAIALYDVYPQTHHNLALALLRGPGARAHLAEAIAELQRAIEMDPGFFHAYGALADAYAAMGDAEQAEFYRSRFKALMQEKRLQAYPRAQP
ncbi:MAG: tetratricopeptide repeat protein [Alphaproteobacteria bacterium]|nr:tetratricopeptide repeat protein [Alphaproteobacteria bacterium]